MSYVIQVWEQPVPVTFEDAEGILDRLFKQRANAPSDRLDRLVRTLWTRYPRDIDNDVSDPVWADTFSKDARVPLPVETLAISTPHLDEVVPVVVEAARDLGLVAYDPQYKLTGSEPLIEVELNGGQSRLPAKQGRQERGQNSFFVPGLSHRSIR